MDKPYEVGQEVIVIPIRGRRDADQPGRVTRVGRTLVDVEWGTSWWQKATFRMENGVENHRDFPSWRIETPERHAEMLARSSAWKRLQALGFGSPDWSRRERWSAATINAVADLLEGKGE